MRSLHLRFPEGIFRVTSRSNEPIGFHSSQGEFPRREIVAPRARQIPAIAARARLLPPPWRRNRAVLVAVPESHLAFSFSPCQQTLKVSKYWHPKSNKDKTIVAFQGLTPLAWQNRGSGESQILFLPLP